MADAAPQIWDIPLTPAQRWGLVQLAFHRDAPQITDSASGKKLRRALRAFGMMQIREVLRAADKINPAMSASDVYSLHKITAENLECVLGWTSIPRHMSIELDVGEVFDLLESIKADPSAYAPPAAPSFSPAGENWAPPPELDKPSQMTCPSCKQSFDLSELTSGAA
jgi:hypothetical protein